MMARRKSDQDERLAWFPLYVEDWLSSSVVGQLTLSGQGVYVALLLRQWQARGAGLPDDVPRLRQMVRAGQGRGWATAWQMLAPLFPVCEDGRRRNTRLHEVWIAQRIRATGAVERASKAGSASAQRRTKAPENLDVSETIANRNCAANSGTQLSSQLHDNTGSQVVENQQSEATASATSSARQVVRQVNRIQKVVTTTTAKSAVVVVPATTAVGATWLDDGGSRTLDNLDPVAHRHAVIAFLADRPPARRRAFLATLESLSSGLGGRGGKAATWWQIGEGVVDAIGSITGDITANALRAFVAKANAEPAKPEAVSGPAPDAPGTVRSSTGEVLWHPGMPEHLKPK